MTKKEKLEKIINLFNDKKIVKIADIISYFDNSIERTTAYRYLKELLEKGEIKEVLKGVYEKKISPLNYFKTPFFERPKKLYNTNFLRKYIPNKTSFLTEKQKNHLLKSSEGLDINTNYYKENRRSLENLMIDLTYASSKLEGNTYSYLDTEVLVNFNEIAEDKEKDETRMIVNHKKAIEYLVYYKNKMQYEAKSFYEIHTLLGVKLLPKLDLGKIREKSVEIGRCQYFPIDNKYQLEEEFKIFLIKLNEIKNPFEQSVFILVFIPYFQIFMDINKRTSRMMCNLPLLKNNLGILSLLQVKERDYITAILSVYELNEVSLLTKIFEENYILNIKRYI